VINLKEEGRRKKEEGKLGLLKLAIKRIATRDSSG
jgi:hypothetical protein